MIVSAAFVGSVRRKWSMIRLATALALAGLQFPARLRGPRAQLKGLVHLPLCDCDCG